MGGGYSSAQTISEKKAEAFLAQQFHGSCDIICKNIQENTVIDIINSSIAGGINITQKCDVNAKCAVSSTGDATSDVLFKAKNSTNAKNSGGFLQFNDDESLSSSRQDIKQTIIQKTDESCKLASVNNMTGLSILAANSSLTGGINIDQSGSTSGSCKLGNNMSAAATATGMSDQTATSGKDKKGQKFGDKAGIGSILGFVVIIVVVFILARMYTGGRDKTKITKTMMKVAYARAEAGCPGGLKPILDHKTGKPIIDPNTMGPICPPPPLQPAFSSPVINIDLGDKLKNK